MSETVPRCPSVWIGAGPRSACSLDDTAEAHAKAIGRHDLGVCHREILSNGVAMWGVTDEDQGRWAS